MKKCPKQLKNQPIKVLTISHPQYVGEYVKKECVDKDAIMELYNKVNEIIDYLDRPKKEER